MMGDLAARWAEVRWTETAEQLWALGVEASTSEAGSWSRGQGTGHKARLAAVGDGMWEEMGGLVPCTAAGSWLTLRRSIPEEAGGPRGSSEDRGGGPLLGSQPPPLPPPTSVHGGISGAPTCAPKGTILSSPEVRVPSDY